MTPNAVKVDHRPIIAAVWAEARAKFGIKPKDPKLVARWMQLRVAELTGQSTPATQPQLFDDELVEPSKESA